MKLTKADQLEILRISGTLALKTQTAVLPFATDVPLKTAPASAGFTTCMTAGRCLAMYWS